MSLRRMTLWTTLLLPLGATSALAQADPMQMAHQAGYNQLGVIEYCQSHGWVDASTVDAQKKVLTALPATSDTSGDSAAEATGQTGTFQTNGNKTSLSDMASTKNTSESAICAQLGSAIKTSAANMANMPTMSGGNMPAMPGGMPNAPTPPAQ